MLGVLVSTWLALRARAEATRAQEAEAVATDKSVLADQERQRAVQSESLSRQFLYAADMNLAQQALAANNFGRVKRLLDQHRPKPGQEDLRNWEWRYLWQHVQSDASFVLAREPWMDGSIQFWDAVPKDPPKPFLVLLNGLDFQFAPGGRSYAIRETNGWISFYDSATGGQKERLLFTNVWNFAISPVGDLLTVVRDLSVPAGEPERMFLQVHNAKTQSLITNISTDGWLVLALSGRGDTLATFSRQTNGHFLRFWDPISWRERGSVVLPKDAINPFVPLETQLSVNENMIACVRGAGFVSVLEIPSGRTVAS